ncbi:hypothetical protein MHYP_G00008010 [Metynnis hypsauchen]
MCGEIIFGNGTKLDFVEKAVLDPIILVLSASNIISIAVVVYLCRKSHSHHKGAAEAHIVKVSQAMCDEALNFAAGSFNNEPQQIKKTEVYSGVIYYQQN